MSQSNRKTISIIILNSEKIKSTSIKIRDKQGYLLSFPLFDIALKFPVNTMRQENEDGYI